MALPITSGETTLPASEALRFEDLIAYAPHGIASRSREDGRRQRHHLRLREGQGLTEHTSPFDALVFILEGSMTLTIGGKPVQAPAGGVTRMPAGVPHALEADQRTRMLLVMLREPKPQG